MNRVMVELTDAQPELRVVLPAEPPEVTPFVAAALLRLLLAVAAMRSTREGLPQQGHVTPAAGPSRKAA